MNGVLCTEVKYLQQQPTVEWLCVCWWNEVGWGIVERTRQWHVMKVKAYRDEVGSVSSAGRTPNLGRKAFSDVGIGATQKYQDNFRRKFRGLNFGGPHKVRHLSGWCWGHSGGLSCQGQVQWRCIKCADPTHSCTRCLPKGKPRCIFSWLSFPSSTARKDRVKSGYSVHSFFDKKLAHFSYKFVCSNGKKNWKNFRAGFQET